MKKIIFLLYLPICLLSCKKELSVREETEKHCWENMEFTCSEPTGDFYFIGKINGEDFCVSNDVDGYRIGNDVWTETVTSTENPTLSQSATPQSSFYGFGFYPPIKNSYNGIYEDFSPAVYLYTPSVMDTTVLLANEFFNRFIKEGDLTLREHGIDKYSGFHFVIGWSCVLLPGYDYYYSKGPDTLIPVEGAGVSSSPGKQKDAIFRISEYKKTVTPDFYIYDLTFEIECDLYRASSSKDRRYYGRLEGGEFKTQVVLPVDE